MRIATIILLAIIALFLLHIANELRKGKTVIFVFGKGSGCSIVNNGQRVVVKELATAIEKAPAQAASSFNLGMQYGKAQFKAITG